MTSAVVLTLAGGCWLVAWNALVLMREWRADVKVVVYLQDEAPPDQVDVLRMAIAGDPLVKSHRLVTQAESEAEFLRFMQLAPESLEGLGDSPFPASVEVSLRDDAQSADTMGRLATRWSSFAGVEEVRFGEHLIRDLSVAARVVTAVLAVVGCALAAGVAVVVGVMVRISLRHRAKEVALLRLFGASEGVVVRPFLLEGVTIGLLGAVSASAVLTSGWLLVQYGWRTTFEGVLSGLVERIDFPMELLVGLVVLGSFVGGLGSLVAVRRAAVGTP